MGLAPIRTAFVSLFINSTIPPNRSNYYKFKVAGYETSFGTLLSEIVQNFAWGEHWSVDHERKTVTLSASTMEDRNAIIHSTLIREYHKDTFKLLNKWSGEVFPVYGPNKELIMSIERVAAPLFGIVTYGVQLLAYQHEPQGLGIWISSRAKTKRTFPGMLDSTVGGSLPTGAQPFACLIREAQEEASFPPELTCKHAIARGTLSYLHLTDARSGGEIGCFFPEVQFLYEMKVSADVTPVPGDGEAEEITLMDLLRLKEALANGEFMPANACVVLEFFIRHGVLTFENEPHYVEIASRLHRVLDLQTA